MSVNDKLAIFEPLGGITGFYGGGGVFTKEVLSRLRDKLEFTLFPTLNSLRSTLGEDNFSEVCEKIHNSHFTFPTIIYNICEKEDNLKILKEPEKIISSYADELKDTRLIYKNGAFDKIIYSKANSKIELARNLWRRDIRYNNDYMVFVDEYYFSKKLDKPFAITIHMDLRPYLPGIKAIPYLRMFEEDPLYFIKRRFLHFNLLKVKRIFGLKNLRLIMTVCPGEAEVWKVPNDKLKVLYPSNGFQPSLLKFRKEEKEDYLIFFARLVFQKGIYDIPFILKELKEKISNVKLYIFGKFYSQNAKDKFFYMIEKFGLTGNIEYLGFLTDEEKYKIISKAKLLIYPSHDDNFPQVILESLAAGTPVVAYDIEGPRSVYKDFKAVKFVREFDFKAFAEEIIKVLKMNEEEYARLINDPKLIKFLEIHKWDNVADEVYKALNRLIN
jgi:glycosyltransferase involved in cell wall biosynthesis